MRLVSRFPSRRPGFRPGSVRVGFVVDKATQGQVSSKYLGFPCHSFYRVLNTHHHPSAGAGTTGQLLTDEPNGLSLTPPQGLHAPTTTLRFIHSNSITLLITTLYPYLVLPVTLRFAINIVSLERMTKFHINIKNRQINYVFLIYWFSDRILEIKDSDLNYRVPRFNVLFHYSKLLLTYS
jgi:hypothetical protein